MTANASQGGAPSRREKKTAARTTPAKKSTAKTAARRSGAPPRIGSAEYLAEVAGPATTSGGSTRRGRADIITRPGSSPSRPGEPSTGDEEFEAELFDEENVADEVTEDDDIAEKPTERATERARRPSVARLAEAHTIETRSSESSWLGRSELIGVAAAFALIVLSAGIAYVVGSQSAEVWSARSEIEYRGQAFVETAALTASSRTALAEVAQRFDVPIDEITDSFTVAQAPNTEVIQLEFQAENDTQVLDILDALTTAFIDRSGDRGLGARIELVQAELDRLQSLLDLRSASVNALDPESVASPAAASSIDELGVLRDQIADLEIRMVDLRLEQIEEAPIVVTAPYLDPEPASGAPLRTAALGALAGAAVAAAAAVALKR